MSAEFRLKSTEALWVLGLIPAEDLPNIAADALAQGFDSSALVELAGQPRNEVQEAPRIFERALKEIGLGGMGKTDALQQYARIVSTLILASKITPLDGAKRIWRATIDAGVAGFHDLDGFVYAASELEDRPNDRELFENAIREEAGRWVEPES